MTGDTIPAGCDGVIVGAFIHAAHGDTAGAEGYVDQFEDETGWRPDKVALFGRVHRVRTRMRNGA
jgi:hypothetical protein